MEIALLVIIFIVVVVLFKSANSGSALNKESEQQRQARLRQEQADQNRQANVQRQRQLDQERELEREWQQLLAEEQRLKAEQERETELRRLAAQRRKQELETEQRRLAAQRQEQERLAERKRQQQLVEEQLVRAARERDAELRRLAEQSREQELKQQATAEQKQKNFCEANTSYCTDIDRLFNTNPSAFQFSTIRRLSNDCGVWNELNNGVAQLQTYEQLSQYIFSFGKMHQEKLRQAFQSVFSSNHLQINGQKLVIIDYGCGQGLGTICFIDYLKSQTSSNWTIEKVKLIEPSELALKRGALNVRYALRSVKQHENVYAIHKELDNITQADLSTTSTSIKLHIFSNILDVQDFNIQEIYQKIIATQQGVNLFICVSPNIGQHRNERLDRFQQYFERHGNVTRISFRSDDIPNPSNPNKPWRRYEQIFKAQLGKQTTVASTQPNLTETSNSLGAEDDLPF